MKIKTSVSVDQDILERAQTKGLNISGTLNRALAEAMREANIAIPGPDKCWLCSKFEEKATAYHPKGLTWLWPAEKWICEQCLRTEIDKIIATKS